MRGGAEQFLEETERSLHDAIMVVRRLFKTNAYVAGGGAIEMELSKTLRDYSRVIAGKEQLLIGAIARALEVIPRYTFLFLIFISLFKFKFYTKIIISDNYVIMLVLMQQIF